MLPTGGRLAKIDQVSRFGRQGRAYQQGIEVNRGWSEDYWEREEMVAMLGGLHIGKQIQRVEENRIMHNRGK